MIAYLGRRREIEVSVVPERIELAIGAALVTCFECSGTKVFLGHPERDQEPCVPCKGTGSVWIGI